MIFVPPLFSVYQPLKLCLLREASGRAVSFCLVVVRLQLNLSHGSEVGVSGMVKYFSNSARLTSP